MIIVFVENLAENFLENSRNLAENPLENRGIKFHLTVSRPAHSLSYISVDLSFCFPACANAGEGQLGDKRPFSPLQLRNFCTVNLCNFQNFCHHLLIINSQCSCLSFHPLLFTLYCSLLCKESTLLVHLIIFSWLYSVKSSSVTLLLQIIKFGAKSIYEMKLNENFSLG